MIDELVRSPLDLVRGSMLHDNNHLLNSAWLLLLGPHRPAILYRLPAIVAGTASVYVAWIFGRSRCAASAVACAGVTAIDHVLVHAGSEARGYGVLSLATLTALVAILEGLQSLPPPPPRCSVATTSISACSGPRSATILAAPVQPGRTDRISVAPHVRHVLRGDVHLVCLSARMCSPALLPTGFHAGAVAHRSAPDPDLLGVGLCPWDGAWPRPTERFPYHSRRNHLGMGRGFAGTALGLPGCVVGTGCGHGVRRHVLASRSLDGMPDGPDDSRGTLPRTGAFSDRFLLRENLAGAGADFGSSRST